MIKTEKVHYCDFCGNPVEKKLIAIHNKNIVCTFAINTDKDENGNDSGYLLDICQKCLDALDREALSLRNTEELQ
jgi:hypothetical protein